MGSLYLIVSLWYLSMHCPQAWDIITVAQSEWGKAKTDGVRNNFYFN